VLGQEQEMLRWLSSWIIPSNPIVFYLVVKSGLNAPPTWWDHSR